MKSGRPSRISLFSPVFAFFLLLSAWSVGAEGVEESKKGTDFSVFLQRLAAEDPEVQTAAIQGLAERNDPATLPLLTGLHEGSLYRWTKPGGEISFVLVQTVTSADGEKKSVLADPLTLKVVGEGDGTDEGFDLLSVRSAEG